MTQVGILIVTGTPRSSANVGSISLLELETWLKWSGSKLLSLPDKNRPASYRVSWPATLPEPNLAYGWSATRLRVPYPSSEDLALCDKICSLVTSIDDLTLRRIVFAATLVTPLNHRRLYSWTDIGALLGLERKAVRRRFDEGLKQILKSTPKFLLDDIAQQYRKAVF